MDQFSMDVNGDFRKCQCQWPQLSRSETHDTKSLVHTTAFLLAMPIAE